MAHIPRIFVEHDLEQGGTVSLNVAQNNYLLRVMRLKAGAVVRAFNGVDGEWQCQMSVHGKAASLEPVQQLRAQKTLQPLSLLFAPLKKTRTDFLVEKACELGVTHLKPVLTTYTQTKTVRIDRLKSLVIEAAEQTERLDIPQIDDIEPLGKVLSGLPKDSGILYCDEASDARPAALALEAALPSISALLIGPEGGFAPKERDLLRSLDFVVPVTLGPRILRAETAAISALTLWQSSVGDWGDRPYVPKSN